MVHEEHGPIQSSHESHQGARNVPTVVVVVLWSVVVDLGIFWE